MGAIRGNAAITWVDADDINTERVLLLREPFRELRPAHQQTVFVADSLDFTQRQTFTVASGVDELIGRVRWMDDQQGLLDLIKAGTKGRTLTYIPSLSDVNRNYACYLISPLSPIGLGMDADRGTAFGELDVELRLRLTSGAKFASDIWALGILFEYIAGGSLSGSTYSRATAGTYRNKFGVGASAAAGASRIQWRSNAQHLLLEAARTQLVTDPENFGAWATDGTIVRTSGQADAFGGTNAYLLDSNLNGLDAVKQVVTFTGNATKCIAPFLKAGTATVTRIAVWNGAVFRHAVHVTWTNGVPSLSTVAGAGTLFPIEAFTTNWYRISIGVDGVVATDTNTFYIYPDIAGGLGTVYAFGANAWNASFPSSYQGPSLGTRNADSLTFSYTPAPQACSWYHKFVELGTNNTSTLGYAGIGDASTSGSLFFNASSSTTYQITHRKSTDVVSTVALSPTYGDTIELLGLLYSDGSVQLIGSKNGAAEITGTRSAAHTLLSSWAASTLRMNAQTAGTEGFTGIQISRIEAGTHINTMTAARNHG